MTKKLGRLALTAMLTTGLVAACAPAQASTPPNRAVVLVASATHAVYTVKATAKHLQPLGPNRGALYAVDADGHRTALPTFKNSGPAVDLVADSLIQVRTVSTAPDASHKVVHWLDLSSSSEGRTSLTDNDTALTAAPGGFIRAHRTGETTSIGEVQTLDLQTYDGTRTPLGSPFPDGTGYYLTAGDGGVIAATTTSDEVPNGDAKIRFMPWGSPGAWRTIFDAHGERYVGCARPSRVAVVCTSLRLDAETPQIGLFRLSDARVVWLGKTHPAVCKHLALATSNASLVAIETSDAGRCTRGKLIRLAPNGRLVASTRHYSARAGITVGLGRILVDRADQRTIYSLTGVTRTPRVLVSRAAIDSEG